MSTTIILVRHGQTEWNRIERFRGRYDISLNAVGIEQAQRTATKIWSHWKPTVVYSSPLSRAKQTASIIADATKEINVQIVNGLADIDYGMWQGLSPEEVGKQWPDLLRDWYEHPERVEIPGGENLVAVRERVMLVLKQICGRHPEQEIVIVGHMVVNRLILLATLGLENDRFWHLGQEPCAINEIAFTDRGGYLVKMNDTCHIHTGVS